MKTSEEIKHIAQQIGQFILTENHGDYKAANDFITKLRINRLELVGGKLVIETSRPGLLIGKRGEQIEKLQAYLNLPLHIEETREHVTDYMYVYADDLDEIYNPYFNPDYKEI